MTTTDALQQGAKRLVTSRSRRVPSIPMSSLDTLPRLGSRVRIPSSAPGQEMRTADQRPFGAAESRSRRLQCRAWAALGRGSLAIRRVERVRDCRARFGEQMAVAIARDADRRVADVGLHLLEVPASTPNGA